MASPNSLPYRFKSAAKAWAGRFGLDIRIKRDPLHFLRGRGICSVLDIGANAGQFAQHVRSTLPEAKIYSFEPLPGPFRMLLSAMAADRNFEAFQLAIGSVDGVSEFEENEFTAASSLLKVNARGVEAWPETSRRRTTEVSVRTLDSWARDHRIQSPYLVKIDVQGYEDKVIGHGLDVIQMAAVIIVEVSFVEIYKGQALFDDIHAQLRQLGFSLHGMIENAYEPATREIIGADAIFLPSCG